MSENTGRTTVGSDWGFEEPGLLRWHCIAGVGDSEGYMFGVLWTGRWKRWLVCSLGSI
jgi:hypothetical protein